MEQTTQSLKELYEKDFYVWVMESIKLLKNKEYDLVDWEDLLEEIEDIGKSLRKSVRSYMAVIMEHLYKWEHFRYSPDMGMDWIDSINLAREEIEEIFKESPSLKEKAQEWEFLQSTWESAISRLVSWFENPKNALLVKACFKGKLPTKKDFQHECPYTFKQVMEYKPWVIEFMESQPKEQEEDKPKDKQIG